MTHETELPLNQEQEAAAEGFFKFLFEPETELIISGPGGVGKTFLMGHLIDQIMPRYQHTCSLMGIPSIYNNVVMTATTNKAAEVLGAATNRPTQTIHSFLNLTVKDDYATGKSMLKKTKNWVVHENMIIFIDESSVIDRPLREMIREGTCKCKVVYVGDHCQLSPIMEPISPIYREKLPFFELTQPMRTDSKDLQALNNQLRTTVETGVFHPIKVVPGVIDLFDDDQMQEALPQMFMNQNTNDRILAYTNARVVDYNDYIRELRQFTQTYVMNERLINNNAIQLRGGKSGMISVEEEVEIVYLDDKTTMVEIDAKNNIEIAVRYADLRTPYGETYSGIPLPEDKEHFNSLVKYYQRQKDWFHYFHLKNIYPDLRPRDAATVHKAQGSTYDTVFVDLNNLSTCHNPNQAARLLYVACSRARKRVIFYGTLIAKYGGILQER